MNSLIKFLLLCIGFAYVNCSFSQAQPNNSWQYQLIKSEKMDQSVKAWFFQTAEQLTTSPTLAVQQEQINWLNSGQTLTLPEGYQQTVASREGYFFGVLSLTEEPADKRFKLLKFDVYTLPGQKMYTLSRTQFYDDSPLAVAISDKDGAVILGQRTTGKLWFHDRNGDLIKEVTLFPDAAYDLERVLALHLSVDGQRLAVVASKRGASPAGSDVANPSGEPSVFLFNQNGEQLWRKFLPEFNTSSVGISPDGEFILANNYTVDMQGDVKKATLLFNKEGKEMAGIDLLFKYVDFSPDSKYVILAENNVAQTLELATGKILWTQQISKDDGMIATVELSNSAKIAAVLVAKNEFKDDAFLFMQPVLKIYDQAGDLQQEIEMTDESFVKPELKLSADHRTLKIGFRDSYRVYEAMK